MLPYWSKLAVFNAETSTSSSQGGDALAASLELTFGVWGSCLTLQNHTAGDSLRGFLAQSTTAPPTNASLHAAPLAEATFTCASFFASGVVSIHCEAAHGLSGGRCFRVEHDTSSSLCDAEQPENVLWLAWGDSGAQNASNQSSPLSSADVTNWLSFLPRTCGVLGYSTVGLSVLFNVLSTLGLAALLVGVGCGSIESRLVHVGALLELGAALSQAAMAGLWALQTHVLHHESARFGCSFYLGLASLSAHVLAAVAAMNHLRLQKDALLELLLLEHNESDSALSVNTKLAMEEGEAKAQGKTDSARAVETT